MSNVKYKASLLRSPHVAIGEVWFDRHGNECFYRDDGSISVRTINDSPSLTIQSEKDSCDIKSIIERFTRTGVLTNFRTSPAEYGDFTNVCDYATARQRLQEADEAFLSLEPHIRERFNNDPDELLTFLGDEDNRSEAIELGLIASQQDAYKPVTVIKADDSQPDPSSS